MEGRGKTKKHTTLPHQLLRNAQSSMSPHHRQAGNVPVLHPVRRLLLHLGQDVADNLGVVVGALGGPRHVDGDIRKLRPRQSVVQVVLEEVVLGKVLDVGVLDQRNIRGAEDADIHLGGLYVGVRLAGWWWWWWLFG